MSPRHSEYRPVTTRQKRRAVSAGAAVVATGAAVAVIQLLQQAVGAFHPRPFMSALFIVSAFLAGLAAGRVRNRRTLGDAQEARREHLRDITGGWPAPTVEGADPVRLGVFPARRDLSADDYIDRPVDRELRAAMTGGAFVLVVGDARAGSSRTAYEAARAKLAQAPILVPPTGKALEALLELAPALNVESRRLVVWLDGLERFADVLDAEMLDALLELAPEVTVVATIRRSEWDAWLAACGPTAPAVRAIISRARVFDVKGELGEEELAALQTALSKTGAAGPIGAALAATGYDETSPPKLRIEHGVLDEPAILPPIQRDLPLLGVMAATLAVLALLAGAWIKAGFTQPSVEDQLAKVERDGSHGGRRVVLLAPPADLHGDGSKSYVLLFVDTPQATRPRSDQLQIYDVHGDHLVRALSFEPQGRRAVFQYRALADLDFDGAVELAGGYGYPDQARQAIVPFAVDWDRGTSRYQLIPLDLGAPALSRRPHNVPEAQYRRVYATTTTFSDGKRLSISGHPVQDFIVTAPPRRLVAGWFLHPWIGHEDAVLQLQPASLDATTGTPHLTPCEFGSKPIVARAGRDRALINVFEDAYAAASSGKGCQSQGLE